MRTRMNKEEKIKEARAKRWRHKINQLLLEEQITNPELVDQVVKMSMHLIDKNLNHVQEK